MPRNKDRYKDRNKDKDAELIGRVWDRCSTSPTYGISINEKTRYEVSSTGVLPPTTVQSVETSTGGMHRPWSDPRTVQAQVRDRATGHAYNALLALGVKSSEAIGAIGNIYGVGRRTILKAAAAVRSVLPSST
jgi:hypothetical protein